MAPSVKQAAHGSSGTTSFATQPTTRVVKATAPTASSKIGRSWARKSRQTVKNALACKSGGKNKTMTSSGSSSIAGVPGITASAMPPITKAAVGGT